MQVQVAKPEVHEQPHRFSAIAAPARPAIADPDLQLGVAMNGADRVELADADQPVAALYRMAKIAASVRLMASRIHAA